MPGWPRCVPPQHPMRSLSALVVGAARTQTMTQGTTALRQGRVADAIALFEATLARAAESSEAHRMAATAYAIRGDIAKSIDHVHEAVRLHPRDERSWMALARTLDETGRLDDAAQVVRDAIAAVPDAGALRWQLAAFAARQQRTADADVALMVAVDRYVLLAGRADLYTSLARLARTHLDYERAIALLEQGLMLTPNDVDAHTTLGRWYIEDGRADDGYAELVVALMLDPSGQDTRIELGRLHLAAGRAAEAIALLEGAGAVGSGDRRAVRILGEALLRVGRTAEGESRLQESQRLQAQAVEEERRLRTAAILTLQAEVRMRERDYAGAIDLWPQVFAIRRGGASPRLRLADALVAAGRLDEAVDAYEAAISLDAGVDVHRRLSDTYEALGRRDDGARERARYIERQLDALRQRAAGAVR
jgi:tetratricopeptide (TPR) repeat protein